MTREEFIENKDSIINNQINKYAKYGLPNYENVINLCYEESFNNNKYELFEISVRRILEKKL